MKKFLSLMLVLLCVVSMVACNGGKVPPVTPPGGNPPAETPAGDLDVFAAAEKNAVPTKIVSLTTFAGKDLTGANFTFSGSFSQVASNNNSILDFKYDRFATVEEAADDYIVTVEGAIAIKDGMTKTIGNGLDSEWAAVIPSVHQLSAFKLDKANLPADYTLSADGKKLTVALDQAEAFKVMGVVIDANGEITLEVESNGKNVSAIYVSYVATSGASVKISTSYTYGVQNLDFSRFN